MSQEPNAPKKRGRPKMVPKIPVISMVVGSKDTTVEKPVLTEPKPDHELTGLTSKVCCDACNPDDGCWLSYGGICIHPHKSGLQVVHHTDPKIMARFEAAKKWLKGLAQRD